MRVGVDTGGTFTDVVALGDDGALRVVKLPSTPARSGASRCSTACARRPAARSERGGALDDGGDQRAARAARRADGAGDHRAASRTCSSSGGRRGRSCTRCIRWCRRRWSTRRCGSGVDERLAADGSVRARADGEALDELRAQRRGARCATRRARDRGVPPARLRQPRARAAVAAGAGAARAADLAARRRCCRCRASTSAPRRRWSTPTCAPVVAPYLERLERALGARLRVHAVERRRAVGGRGGGARPVRTLLSGPAAGVVGALAVARAAGVDDADHARHGRHLDRRRADRRRRGRARPTRRRSPAARCSCRCWRCTPSAPAADRSPGSTRAARSRSGPSRPAPSRARPPTVAAARADGDRRQPGARAAAGDRPPRRRHAAVAGARARGARARSRATLGVTVEAAAEDVAGGRRRGDGARDQGRSPSSAGTIRRDFTLVPFGGAGGAARLRGGARARHDAHPGAAVAGPAVRLRRAGRRRRARLRRTRRCAPRGRARSRRARWPPRSLPLDASGDARARRRRRAIPRRARSSARRRCAIAASRSSSRAAAPRRRRPEIWSPPSTTRIARATATRSSARSSW